MLIFQSTIQRTRAPASQKDFSTILSDSQFQLKNYYILDESINNFYLNIPISERLHDVIPAQPTITDELFKPACPPIKTQLKGGEGKYEPSEVMAKDLPMPVDGYQDVGYITRPTLAAYRKVLSKFSVDQTGAKQLGESLRTPMELIISFFSNSLEGRIPDEERRKSLIEGIDSEGVVGLRQKLSDYFLLAGEDNSKSITAEQIFDDVIVPFLLERGFTDGTNGTEDKISPIRLGFFNQPKNIAQILISATFDRVATSDLSTDAKILAYEKKCMSDNLVLLYDIQKYVKSLFGKELAQRITPYMYYYITKKDLGDAQAIEKLTGEMDKHLHFINEMFLEKTWEGSPESYNSMAIDDFGKYYKAVMEAGANRGQTKTQVIESIRQRYAELEAIKNGFETGEVLQAWRDFASYRAKYATSRYYEYDNDQYNPEEFCEKVLKAPDFVPSEDVASYIAVTAALNMIGRNVAIEPSPGKNLMSIEFASPKEGCKTTTEPARESKGESQGVEVTSQATWEVSVNDLTTIVVPDMEILKARALDYLTTANHDKNNAKISHELSADGRTHIFTMRDEKIYASEQDAKAHQTTFYVPGSLREDEQNLTTVPIYISRLGVENRTERFIVEPKPEYFDASLSFGVMDYENIHDPNKEKTVTSFYGESNVSGEIMRKNRRTAKESIEYANLKYNLGIPTPVGLTSETWGQSKVIGHSGYWWGEKLNGYTGEFNVEALNKFFWDNAPAALNETIQQREQSSMEASELMDEFRDKNGNFPKVYESLESLMKYAGPVSYHKYVSDLYLTFVKDAYSRMPSGEEKDKMFNHIYDTYVDNLSFYPKHFLKNQQGLQFTLGSSMRLMEEMTKRMLESGPAVHLESTWLGIPFTNIGVSTSGLFYADVAYIVPYGEFTDRWERKTSFGPAAQVPGLAGSTVNFQNMDGFAATLGWKGLLWSSKTDKSHLKGKLELGAFIMFPKRKQTEEIQTLLDSSDRLMEIWSKYDRKNENTIDKTAMRSELNALKKFFGKSGPKHDPKALDIIDKIEYAMNNEWDDLSRTNLEGALYALANSDIYDPGHIYTYYSGEELGASFMSYGTFMNDLGRYQGVERFAQMFGAGYAKVELDFDSEVAQNLPYNVRLSIHPVVPFLIDDVATSLVSKRPLFIGDKPGQVITGKKIMEGVMEKGKDYLSPDFPVTLIDTDIGYIYPFSADICSKIGVASSFNLFAFDMEKSDFYMDFRFSDWMNVRLKHGFEKTLKYSPYLPNVGASAQVFLSDNLAKVMGMEKLPVDLSFNMLWERDLPGYDFSRPHLETFGYNLMLSTSISKLFGQSESNKKVMSERNVREADNITPHGLMDWRKPSETFLQWRMGQQEKKQKDASLLRTLTPDERKDLANRKVLMAEDKRTYYHPITREMIPLEQAISLIHKERWESRLLGLLTPEERAELKSRQSSVHMEKMYLDEKTSTYISLEDAIFEIFDSKAKARAEREFVKFMSSS